VIPRASVVDPRPLATLRRLAWWRSPSPAIFLAGFSVTAGTLQLAGLLVDQARAGGALPGTITLLWAWLGLIVIAAIPASADAVTGVLRSRPAARRRRLAEAVAAGAIFYAILPLAAVGDGVLRVAGLLAAAALWHPVIALGPQPRLPGSTRPR
jgi:hypothetical protein